jgi:hypothetical protein
MAAAYRLQRRLIVYSNQDMDDAVAYWAEKHRSRCEKI